MRIVLAEDESTTRMLISRMLSRWGFEVLTADNGAKAWELLDQPDAPRLAVLDWMMPELDGIEVCRRVRAREAGPYTYIILITGRDRGEDMARALACGADDYLTKPLGALEFQARLGVARRALDYDAKLEAYASQMEALAEKRAQQLVGQERMVNLGAMVSGIAGELSEPATTMAEGLAAMRRLWSQVQPMIEGAAAAAADPTRGAELSGVLNEFPSTLAEVEGRVVRMRQLVAGLEAFTAPAEVDAGPVAVARSIERALELCAPALRQAGIKVAREDAADVADLSAPGERLEQVLVNLLRNAIDAVAGVDEPRVQVSLHVVDGAVEVTVHDNGPGVAAEMQDRIWDPFFSTKGERGTGLGLSICQRLLSAQGGTLTLDTTAQGGARFVVRLPLSAPTGLSGAPANDTQRAVGG